MQKRILSLLLVLCMILPMIPVGVISVFAAEEDALPSSTLTPDAVTLPEKEGGKVTLPEGWSFVAHGAQDHPNTTAPHNGYATTYVLDTYGAGGIYCALNGTENGTGVDFAASWDSNANGIDVTRLPVICFNGTQGQQIDMGINACVVYSGGYAYKAPSTGYITIELDNVATGGGTQGGGWGGTGDTLVALFVDGKMVWPAAEGSYDDRATWYNLNGNGGQNKTDLTYNGATVKDVYVEAGQSVEFLVYHSWWDNPVKADMTVTYTKEIKYTSTFDRDDSTITVDKDYNVILPDSWSLIVHNANNYTETKPMTTVYNGGDFVPGLGGEGGWVCNGDLGWGGPRIPWFNDGENTWDRPDYHGAYLGLGSNQYWNAGYVYTAEYTGYVDININEIVYADLFTKEGWGTRKYLAVFVDGNMVWPTKGGSYTNEAAWISAEMALTDTNLSLLKDIYVEEGQKVELLAKSNDAVDAVYVGWSVDYTSFIDKETACIVNFQSPAGVSEEVRVLAPGMTTVAPTYASGSIPFLGWDADGDGDVDYKAGDVVAVNESMELTAVIAQYIFDRSDAYYDEDTNTVVLPNGWSLNAYNASNYSDTTPLTNVYDGSEMNPGLGGEGGWIIDTTLGGWGWGGSPRIPWRNGVDDEWCHGAYLGLGALTDWNAGYTYTAEYTGYVNISIDQIVDLYMNNTDSWANPDKYIAIFVDGAMVWPTAGGSYTDVADWQLTSDNMSAASLDQSLLEQSFFVKEGDTIGLLAKSSGTSDAVYVGWTVTYSAILPAPGVFDRNDVEYDADNNTVTLPDNWALITHNANNYAEWKPMINLYSFTGDEFHQITEEENAYGWIMNPDIGWPWGDSPRIPWVGGGDDPWCHGAYLGLGSLPSWNAGYAYTVQQTGYVDISIDEIVDRVMDCTDDWANPDKYIAIFVNGTMVWPTAGGSYTDVADWQLTSDNMSAASLDQSLLKSVFVEEGDAVELLAKSTGSSDAVYVGWTVAYTNVADKDVSTDASVALGDKFAVDFTVDSATQASESGIYVDGVKYADNYLKDGIAAADLDEMITYAPYQVINGIEYKGAEKEISVLDILALYTGNEQMLAQATILYAKAADAYFDETVTEVPAEVDAMIDAAKAAYYNGASVITEKTPEFTDNIDETAAVVGANIYLNDTIDMKLFFVLADGVDIGTVKVVVSGAAEATVTEFTTTEIEGTTCCVASIDAIPMANYGTDMTIEIYAGDTVISETLTYSVLAYAYDVSSTAGADAKLVALLETIVMLGDAANIYNA